MTQHRNFSDWISSLLTPPNLGGPGSIDDLQHDAHDEACVTHVRAGTEAGPFTTLKSETRNMEGCQRSFMTVTKLTERLSYVDG